MANFNGGFGGGNMQQLLKQAKRMQEEMVKKQEELEQTTFSSSVAGGMVECIVNGKKELQSIKIKPEAVDLNDIEMLEDLIKAAVNEAGKRVDDTKQDTMGGLPGGLF